MGETQRVYHFTTKFFGLEDIEKRRLKVARITELNDPFEFLAPRAASENEMMASQTNLALINDIMGILCFNSDWNNPVHWSHYAAKHQGICLGFDVDISSCFEVIYREDRIDLAIPDKLDYISDDKHNVLFQIMLTKYVGWSYERERRMFQILKDRSPEGGNYFQSFRDILQLKEVTIGVKCDASGDDIRQRLGEMQPEVDVYKAKLSATKFEIGREAA